jgi:hypothetical protein
MNATAVISFKLSDALDAATRELSFSRTPIGKAGFGARDSL